MVHLNGDYLLPSGQDYSCSGGGGGSSKGSGDRNGGDPPDKGRSRVRGDGSGPPLLDVEERREARLPISLGGARGLPIRSKLEVSRATARTAVEEASVSRDVPMVDLSSDIEEDTGVVPPATPPSMERAMT